jgi:molybdenum cofactor guanylyltransferase
VTAEKGSDPFSALILAGGRATRLGGIDKRELVVEGETIFARQVRVLAPRVAEIIVATGAAIAGYRTVADPIAGLGPIAGISAGLAAATTPWLLVVAGDMPYLTGALIDRLLAAALDGVDAVGIKSDGLPEPLCCVLRVAAARPVIERRLAERRLKASEVLTDAALRVAWLEDVERGALTNINTPADLS